MSIDWKHLRTLDGSQQTAFEELCCQLARYEVVPNGAKFFRVGAPDAGVECYWKLPDEKEIGWQAKFFLSPPNDNQWSQIDKSVKTALEKHPNLIQYYVCLPINRQDPRIKNRKSFMDKWNERVKKWKNWAEEKGMSVTFDYWGESEIWDRLSHSEHRGRYYFWFNKELFDQRWFENQVKPNIEYAGERYSAKLNFTLPIAKNFDGLGRTDDFFLRLENHYSEIRSNLHKATTPKAKELLGDKFAFLIESVKQIKSLLINKRDDTSEDIDFGVMDKLCSECFTKTEDLHEELKEKEKEIKRRLDEKRAKEKSKVSQDPYVRNEFGYERHYLWELEHKFRELRRYIEKEECKLANTPALLLVGNWGTGKTHLFCDIAERRLEKHLPTILLHGIHFSSEEFWSQVIKQLGLSCTRDELLGALEATAQAVKAKTLILIDALNESDDRSFWKNNLAGILWILRNYNWISIAVSVRSSYEEITIPEHLVPERKIIKVEHHGFGDKTFEATDFFFKEYGIKAPSVPILNPEFQTPLFLKTFCEAIKNFGLTEVPKGLQGITSVFYFFIESVNKKISEKLGFDKKESKVKEAVRQIADAMNENGVGYLQRDTAKQIINQIHSASRFEDTLFYNLLSEGVLSEDIVFSQFYGIDKTEVIRFTYDKFTDNLRANTLLNKFLDEENPQGTFLPDKPLGKLFTDELTAWNNKGIFEALCIQLPERIGRELFELIPGSEKWELTKDAFIQSLIWRNPKAIGDSAREYVNENILSDSYYKSEFWDVLLTVSANPEHLWNADFLHYHLMKFEMAKRDAWWSLFLHEHYTERDYTAIHRLIDWAWSDSDKSHIDDESIRLCGVTLAWFLTSSNRFLRDSATKALVSLFTNRVKVLTKLIEQFLGVNDLYVLERLLAVAYGCAMRSNDNEAIAELAQLIYEWIFKDGKPIPHLLLRDYARGVIEVALYQKLDIKVNVKKIRPPYKSPFPKEIPTKEELKEKYDGDGAQGLIYFSVMEFGDFARYIIGTNHHFSGWRNRRLNEPLSERDIYKDFECSLNEKQEKTYETYKTVKDNIKFYRESNDETRLRVFNRLLTEEELESSIAYFEDKVRKVLGKRKSEVFDRIVVPYLESPKQFGEDHYFDNSLAQRWILQRVFDLGWNGDYFGEFDYYVNRYTNDYRSSHKAERIGKKYQWIAYFEFMAYMADNFQYSGDSWSNRDDKYLGPWQGYRRDIDPSSLLKKTKETFYLDTNHSWWFPVEYNFDFAEQDVEKWLRISDDLPNVKPLIEVVNPKDNSVWLNLDSHFHWSRKWDEEKKNSTNERGIKYSLSSYLVKREHFEEVYKWALKQNFININMPYVHGNTQMYLGEYYWSPAYDYFNVPYYHHDGWTQYWDKKVPKEVLLTAEEYLEESSDYDCSVEESFTIKLPTKFIADKMKLNWKGIEGCFFDENGELTFFNPSVREKGNGALLVNKNKFLEFLDKKGLSLFWILRGEKASYNERVFRKIRPLDISGVYYLKDGFINGRFDTSFEQS